MASHTIPVVNAEGNGGVIIERNQNNLMASGSFSGLTSKVATAIAGGIHIHTGDAGSSGAVAFVLNPDFASDTLSATMSAMNNVFSATDQEVMDLLAANNYINLHTVANQSGALRGQLLQDDNRAPGMSMVTAPMNGASVSVDGLATSTFDATWSSTTDVDMNNVVYVWELAADSNFSMPVVAMNVATMTTFSTTHDVVDSVLVDLGLNKGDSVDLYHRVVATDGSMDMASTALDINLLRVVTSGINDGPAQVAFKAFPNPATNNLNLSWSDAQYQRVEIIAISGQQVLQEQVVGATNSTLDVSSLPSGLYFIKAITTAGSQETAPIVIQ